MDWDKHWGNTWRKDGKWALYCNIVTRLVERKGDHAVSLVDVGCGVGALLDRTKNMPGFSTIGIDLSSIAVRLCGARNIKAVVDDVSDGISVDGRFNFITAIDLLDCLDDPIAFLIGAKSALADDGFLVVSVCSKEHGEYKPVQKLDGADVDRMLTECGYRIDESAQVTADNNLHHLVFAQNAGK